MSNPDTPKDNLFIHMVAEHSIDMTSAELDEVRLVVNAEQEIEISRQRIQLKELAVRAKALERQVERLLKDD